MAIHEEMYGHTHADFRQHTDSHTNGCILLTIGSIYTKLGDFVKIGLHFITMWINIIYRLVPSPLQFEIRKMYLLGFLFKFFLMSRPPFLPFLPPPLPPFHPRVNKHLYIVFRLTYNYIRPSGCNFVSP